MSKSKRKRNSTSKPRRAERRRHVESSGSPLESVLKWGIGVLLFARMLIPTEASVEGDSLWVVQLWLLLGLLWAWVCHLNRDYSIRFGWIDVALWLLVAGHVISALAVFWTGGDKRAALNVMWEWVGLGIGFFLMRQIIRTRVDGRKLLLSLVAVSAVLSGYGLWQHYYSIPQTASLVASQMRELKRREGEAAEFQAANRPLSNSTVQRIQELRRELRNVPHAEPARTLFLQRLQSSTEPFGMFALANSFAGLLAPLLVLAMGLILNLRRTGSMNNLLILAILIVLPTAFCLILTKSRTAWVGCGAGILVWGGLRIRRGGFSLSRRKLVQGLALLGFVVALIVAAGLSGGLDREVFTEAGKSFTYRWQYWKGAGQVVQDHPLLGTGPGNFRQHYLKYKAPESSEEITDPHNLFLDVWTSGGLVALIGLIFFCIEGLRKPLAQEAAGRKTPNGGERLKVQNSESENLEPSSRFIMRASDPLIAGTASSFVVVPCCLWVLGDNFELRMIILFGGFVALTILLARLLRSFPFPKECLAGAGVALLVHLLGAGGIEMPSVAQTLFILVALGMVRGSLEEKNFSNRRPVENVGRKQGRRPASVLMIGVGCALLFGICLATSFLPVLNRKSAILLGDVSWTEDGNPGRAMVFYKAAAEADPFSPEPPERLAEISFRQWENLPAASDQDFSPVSRFSKLAIELDPHNYQGYRELGRKYLQKFERSANPDDAVRAADYLSRSVLRYPNHANLRAERAQALVGSGQAQPARQEAETALRLDRINRKEGHVDKFLPRDVREKMRSLSGEHPQQNSGSDRN